MLICFEPRFAKVWLDTGPYFGGVWSKFMTKDDGMSCSSANLMIWWWYKRPASFFAPSGMTDLPVVADRLTNPIRWNELFVQDVFPRSITFRFLSSLFAIRACAISNFHNRSTIFTTAPFFRIACRYFMTFSWISDPNGNVLPRLTFVELVRPYSYFFRWSRTVLPPIQCFANIYYFFSRKYNIFLFFGMFEIEVETISPNSTAPTPMSSFDISIAEFEPIK